MSIDNQTFLVIPGKTSYKLKQNFHRTCTLVKQPSKHLFTYAFIHSANTLNINYMQGVVPGIWKRKIISQYI